MPDFKVRKKDGQLQDYDRGKVIGGLIRSGASSVEAEQVAAQVDAWLPSAILDGAINSGDLRLKIISLLEEVNLRAAANYRDYQKSAVPSSTGSGLAEGVMQAPVESTPAPVAPAPAAPALGGVFPPPAPVAPAPAGGEPAPVAPAPAGGEPAPVAPAPSQPSVVGQAVGPTMPGENSGSIPTQD
ncbi:MAG: hypothetical protein JW991_00405 [Candidatus Pacebacteria bacterium]|nr:hypothetical protein [Candidatus Paceibacterota bacterium]